MIEAIKNLDEFKGVIKWRVTHNCNFSCSYCIQKYCVDQPDVWGTLEEDEARSIAAAPDISRIMEEMSADKIKLDLVGGEVTLFDLETLLANVTSTKLAKVYIVTNFYRPKEYFESLATYLKTRDCELEVCASWHSETIDFDTYSAKILSLKDVENLTIKCEKVNTGDNTEEVEQIKEFCEENDINYLIDISTDFSATSINRRLRGELKTSFKKTHPRFMLYKDDDTQEECWSQNALITGQVEGTESQITKLKEGFKTKDWYCSRDIDYVYVMIDYHHGIVDGQCRQKEPLADFHIKSEPHQCEYPSCNFCGKMSVAKEKDKLLEFLETETTDETTD